MPRRARLGGRGRRWGLVAVIVLAAVLVGIVASGPRRGRPDPCELTLSVEEFAQLGRPMRMPAECGPRGLRIRVVE